MHLKKITTLSSIILLLVILPFVVSPLSADDGYAFFYFGTKYFYNPSSLIADAWYGSIYAFNSGQLRFISNFYGGLGYGIVYGLSQIFMLNSVFVFGLFRVILSMIMAFFIYKIVDAVLKNAYPKEFIFSLTILSFSIFAVSNNIGGGAFRIIIFNYTLSTIFFLIILHQLLESLNKKKNSFFLFVLAILSVFINEFTQILIFIFATYFGFIIVTKNIASIKRNQWKFLKNKNFYPIYVYLGTALLLFVPLRYRISQICGKDIDCYAPSDIELGGISLLSVIDRMFSQTPFLNSQYVLLRNDHILGTKIYWEVAAAVIIIIFPIITWINYRLKKINQFKFEVGDNNRNLFNLMVLGIIVVITTSVGMASSRALQGDRQNRWIFWENLSLLNLGAASRDTTLIAVGATLVFTPLLIISLNYAKRNFYLIIHSAVVTILISSSIATNYYTSRLAIKDPLFIIQSNLANQIIYIDKSQYGDASRCLLLAQKLDIVRAWEGHDRGLFGGLELATLKEGRTVFCSRDEKIFKRFY